MACSLFIFFKNTPSLRFNLTSQSWMSLNRSANSVTARYGHSLAVHKVCARALIYAGCTIHTNKHAENFLHIEILFFCVYDFSQDKIYMYGGKMDSTGNVTAELWVFHIRNQSWELLNPQAKEQYAVVGHSAHIVHIQPDEPVMLVIFGHCPLYGYISQVQQYDIG